MAVATTLVWFSLLVCVKGDIFIQGPYECGTYERPIEIRVTDKDEEVIYSQSTEFYQAERNCIVTVIGKLQSQFTLTLTTLNIDSRAYRTDFCKGLCCNDFLKIYNSYRVDNARLLPAIPQRGLCGTDLPRVVTFTTTQNYFTIQFKTDIYNDAMRGFVLRLLQTPWRNPGNVYPDGGYFGGWNDGLKSELRFDWSEQAELPGDWDPGADGESEADREQGGPSCYVCFNCKFEFFDPKYEFATEEAECYVCSKRWVSGFAQADRNCYTRIQYTNLLLTLTDPSVGDGKVTEYRGCKRFMTYLGEFYNYCFCDGNLCNAAEALVKPAIPVLLISLFVTLLQFRNR